ncbi:hypothetical protein BGZ99_008298 [Dissophora globulifera]|uniref:C2H2-type domain-containing protein n=1 Tax=Dissophora globulifera TaxID=979702 RepID=A0A9P6UNM8_9FUNG|nr:hypothetical protein BGZ99_008298 [Dissophora globulifera]
MATAMDEDEEDEEDDGEIKQDIHSRRSVSVSGAGQGQLDGAGGVLAGSSKKQQLQSSEHSDVHKCLDCGKVYKHPNCLWKHRWLHSAYWKNATKFLLSKHQQVQLMEAAAILLGMDESREADKDSIVSLFSMQRGALAYSVGSSQSTTASWTSASASPATSTKSLSTSPPPPSKHALMSQAAESRPQMDGMPVMTEAQNSDVQMLAALRNGHGQAHGHDYDRTIANVKAELSESASASQPAPASAPAPAPAPAPSSSSSPSSPSSSPPNSKSTTSSSTSTPPTLALDDESLPDDDSAMVSPPAHRSSMPAASSAATLSAPSAIVRVVPKKVMEIVGPDVIEMGLGMEMELDEKPLIRPSPPLV